MSHEDLDPQTALSPKAKLGMSVQTNAFGGTTEDVWSSYDNTTTTVEQSLATSGSVDQMSANAAAVDAELAVSRAKTSQANSPEYATDDSNMLREEANVKTARSPAERLDAAEKLKVEASNVEKRIEEKKLLAAMGEFFTGMTKVVFKLSEDTSEKMVDAAKPLVALFAAGSMNAIDKNADGKSTRHYKEQGTHFRPEQLCTADMAPMMVGGVVRGREAGIV